MKKRKNRVNPNENIKKAKVIKSYKANLILLECRIIEQEKVAKKAKTIKNLRITKYALKKSFSYILISGLVIAGSKKVGLGYPFYRDQEVKVANYSLERDIDGLILADKIYENQTTFSKATSKIIVYSPWKELPNGTCEREKTTYKLKANKEIYDAFLKEDYAFIFDNLKESNKEKEVSHDENTEYKFLIEASLNFNDKEDCIYYLEDVEDDFCCTIAILSIILYISIIKIRIDLQTYKETMDEYKKEYEKEIEKLEKLRDKHTEATKHLEFLKMNGC